MTEATTNPPAMHRSRPIDATGWFWSLVLLMAGSFYGHMGGVLAVVGTLLLLASPVCFIWQFWKWRHDSVVNRQATAWCQKYYASYGHFPVVDFMVAIAHDSARSFDDMTPSTPLDELNWIAADDEDVYWGTGYSNRHQVWLADLMCDARMQQMDLSEFSGTTLHDAIHFVVIRRNPG